MPNTKLIQHNYKIVEQMHEASANRKKMSNKKKFIKMDIRKNIVCVFSQKDLNQSLIFLMQLLTFH